MDFYIHRLNPVLLPLGGEIAVRWYGLAYLAGFLGAFLMLRRRSRRGEFRVAPDRLENFILLLAVCGVFLGGRLGYVLLYGMEHLRQDWLYPLKVWEGGMASHGGMLGVILAMLWYARRHAVSFWHLSDNIAMTAPIGLFFGRIANFINGELYGRVSDVPWAVVFPQEAGLDHTAPLYEIRALLQSGGLHPRHPSQLYEAFGEGLFLFLVLQWAAKRPAGRREGMLSVLFLVFYAVARIGVEFFREPDSTVYFGWMTKGQLYSFFMLLTALLIYVLHIRRKP